LKNIVDKRIRKKVPIKKFNRNPIKRGSRKRFNILGDKNIELEENEYFSADDAEQDLHNKVLKYVRENAESLGITNDFRLRKEVGSKSPLVTSNVEEIINHIIRNNGVRKRPLPTGYDHFLRRIDKHTFLKNLLFPPSTSTQTGTGVFSFKPSLWRN